MTTRKRSLKPTSKAAWAQANDAGPHLAVLATGKVVKFRIPDQSALLRSGRLPDELHDTVLLIAAHPEGPEGYFEDRARMALVRGEDRERLAREVQLGMTLRHLLVAEMLVEPEVTAEEVESGMFHEFDIDMLIEFAERKRSVDAAGNHLPIITLDEWARFRNVPAGPRGTGAGAANGDVDPGALPDADAGEM